MFAMALTSTPSKITVGDSVRWTRSFAEYPAPGWALSYAFVMSGESIRVTGEQSGSSADHLISIPAATSADWTAGTYSYQAYVTSGNDRFVVETGTIVIAPDFTAQSSGLDNRSLAAKALAALESVILIRTSQPHLEYTIKDRNMRFAPIPELLASRDKLRAEVQREHALERRRKKGGSLFKAVKVRFT
ncbi:hypothetical protein [Chlorobium sp.]|uniref:hypothetical protein n=1 Tax=Chlorobium sp. TaxID=1095 RepID=UPI003C5684C1